MKIFSAICAVIWFLAAIIRPLPTFAADLDLARGKMTTAQYLSALDKRSFCNKANTRAAIQDEVKLNKGLRPLYQRGPPETQRRENLCLRVKKTNQEGIERIKYYKSLSTPCGLRSKDLAPLFADHRDTVRLMNRVCSEAFLREPLPDILRFDHYKMPPFPE
jgi:hypothetical protein